MLYSVRLELELDAGFWILEVKLLKNPIGFRLVRDREENMKHRRSRRKESQTKYKERGCNGK